MKTLITISGILFVLVVILAVGTHSFNQPDKNGNPSRYDIMSSGLLVACIVGGLASAGTISSLILIYAHL